MIRQSIIIGLGMLAIASPAAAQEGQADAAGTKPADAAASGTLEDIVVTAQKRAESVQDVPISISALSATKLEASGIDSTTALTASTTGLNFGRQTLGTIVFIRGVGTQGTQAGQEASVPLYVDGVYMISPQSNNFSFNGIERIEVLKGPQGTLFGRNATGGLINIITKRPSQTPSMQASIEVGNYRTIQAKLYATTGLADWAAWDVAAVAGYQDEGYGTNLATGRDVNRGRDAAVRSKLLLTPTEDLEVTIAGDYSRSVASFGLSRQPAPGALAADGVTGYTGDWQDTNQGLDPIGKVTQGGVSVRAEYDAGAVRLVNIAAFRKSKSLQIFNQDATPARLVDVTIRIHDKFFSNEFQILSNNGGDLDWIVGAFYMFDNAQLDPTYLAGPGVGGTINILTEQVTRSYAGFAQATWRFTDRTSATAGIRYTRDERRLDGRTLFGPVQIAQKSQADHWSEPTWRLSLQHDFSDDVMAYVSYNRGFKSGGYASVNYANPAVDPEILNAYEVGVKSDLADRRVRLNVSAFYYDYKDLQVNRIVPGGSSLLNASAAKIKGVEAQFEAALGPNVSINAGATYLDAKYKDFANGPLYTPRPTGGNAVSAADLSGNRIARSPEWSANFGVTAEIPLETGSVGGNFSGYYSSRFPWEADNRFKQGAYVVLNGELYWQTGEHLKIAAFMRNITDVKYSNYSESTALGDMVTPAPPRTYGLRASVSF